MLNFYEQNNCQFAIAELGKNQHFDYNKYVEGEPVMSEANPNASWQHNPYHDFKL